MKPSSRAVGEPGTGAYVDKDRTGPDLDERSVHFQYVTEIQYVTEPGNFFGQINPFLPARRRPTVDHSLMAGGAQRQELQTCLPVRSGSRCASPLCVVTLVPGRGRGA